MMTNLLQKDIDWVKKVVLSCKTEEQLLSAEKCLENLTKKWVSLSNNDKIFFISKLSETEKDVKSLIFRVRNQFL